MKAIVLATVLVAPALASADAIDPKLESARRAYEEAFGGECARIDPEVASPPSIHFDPERAQTRASAGAAIPPEEVHAVDQLLTPVAKKLAACHSRIEPHASWLSVRYDFSNKRWSAEPGLEPVTSCVRDLIGKQIARLSIKHAATLSVAFDANRPPTEAEAARNADGKKSIQTFIAAHLNDVRACYEHALPGWPALSGKVEVRVTIEPDGRVSKSRVKNSTTGLPNLDCCVANAVRSWQFPKREDGGLLVITYPFVFRSDAK